MVCVHCGSETRVTNSRPQQRSNRVWRRRQCENCSATFTTLETAEYGAVWLVRRANGQLAPFSRDTLFLSLYDACRHRPDAGREAADLTDTVIRHISRLVNEGALLSMDIAKTAHKALKHFDMPAGVYYAAYHQL